MGQNRYQAGFKFTKSQAVAWMMTLIMISCGPEKKSPVPQSSLKHSKDSGRSGDANSYGTPTARSPRGQKRSSDPDSTPLPEPQISLGWDEPIRLQNFDLAPNSNIEGKTIKNIVESLTAARDDGKLCSECHNSSEAAGTYGLAIPKNGTLEISDPWDTMGTQIIRSWAGDEGWAERFAANKTKPPALRLLMKAWSKGDFDTDPH